MAEAEKKKKVSGRDGIFLPGSGGEASAFSVV